MNAHIFIDAENIKPEIGFKVIEKFSGEYSVEQVEIIGNETTLSSKYLEASNRYNIKNSFYGKNSADTWLCTEIAKTIFENPAVEIIILVSSDRDFLAAIKLATDQKRKVILVSDGNGHKNLKAMLYDLRINPDLIELVDFKTDFETVQPAKKKIPVKPAENLPQNITAEKVKVLIKKNLPDNLKAFYYKNEKSFKFIKLKYAGRIIEVPFLDGINLSTFTNFLIGLKIISDGNIIQHIISENSLKLEDNKIYIEEKISEPEKTPFDDVINYFVAHAAETKNIFIKCNGKLHEVPFTNGISLAMFSRLLKGYEISDDADKTRKIIADSFLELRNNRVYFPSEEEFPIELKPYIKNIPKDALEFILQNEDKLKIVSIAHNDAVYKVPFVDGIQLSIFAHMLRHLKIIGKNASSQKVLAANGFTVKNNLVFKK